MVILLVLVKKKYFLRYKINCDNEKKKKLFVYFNYIINFIINIYYYFIGVFLCYFFYFESIFCDFYVIGVVVS